jgi:archaellum component FlaC
MDTVNAWIGALLGGFAIVAAVAGAMRWMLHIGLKQVQIIVDKTVDAAMAGQDGRFTGIEQRFDQIDRRFDGIDQRFDGIDRRLDGIDQRFDGIDRRLDGIDQRFDGIDRRLDGIDADIQRLDTKVDHLAEVVDLRMRPLEVDMGLLKQHLLGTPAA